VSLFIALFQSFNERLEKAEGRIKGDIQDAVMSMLCVSSKGLFFTSPYLVVVHCSYLWVINNGAAC
jgi:hypothetical protein